MQTSALSPLPWGRHQKDVSEHDSAPNKPPMKELRMGGLDLNPVAEFSVSICSTPKFICSSDDGVYLGYKSQELLPLIKITFTKTGRNEIILA